MQRRALLVAAAALAAAVAFGFGAVAFDAVPADQSPPLPDSAASEPSGGGGGGNVPDDSAGGGAGACVLCGLSARSLVAGLLPAVDPLLFAGVAVLVVAAAGGLGLRATEDARIDDPSGDGPSVAARDERDATATAPADADATNDVYRAWAALTERVPVSAPDATTPREYAAAAVDAGFDRDAVARLTDAFASIRYGGAEPTDDREREARTALDEVDADR